MAVNLLANSTTALGREAEDAVVLYLEERGHRVEARNFRTRFYEIDIISLYDDKIFFTEVKYRKNAAFGGGLEYITPKKLEQMRFAAEAFLKDKKLSDCPATLAAAGVSGEDFAVDDWMEIEE